MLRTAQYQAVGHLSSVISRTYFTDDRRLSTDDFLVIGENS